MQISCLPHIFEAILWDEINEECSKCTFDNGCVLFELQKKNSVHWECLTLKKSKEELKKLKYEILNNIIEERQNKSQHKAGMYYNNFCKINCNINLVDVDVACFLL